MDEYCRLIKERGADEAAKILAKCCRQRDKDIKALRKTVKGRYIYDEYDEPVACECSECGAALAIVDDPVKEQPNYCFKCGASFDWRGVYEAIEEGMSYE